MKVKIYTTPACPYCVMAKDFLKEKKIEFEEVDVTKDQKALNEMIEKTGQVGVPVIEFDDKVIVGFNRKELKKALKLK